MVEESKKPQPGEFWETSCGDRMYVVGLNPHDPNGFPLVFVESCGISHTATAEGMYEIEEDDESDMDLIRHLPGCDSFEWTKEKP